MATEDRRLTQTPYKTVYCNGSSVLGGCHRAHLFFLSLCIRVSAIIRLLVHIDALVLIPSTGFKENFLRFLEATTNGHEWTPIREGADNHGLHGSGEFRSEPRMASLTLKRVIVKSLNRLEGNSRITRAALWSVKAPWEPRSFTECGDLAPLLGS